MCKFDIISLVVYLHKNGKTYLKCTYFCTCLVLSISGYSYNSMNINIYVLKNLAVIIEILHQNSYTFCNLFTFNAALILVYDSLWVLGSNVRWTNIWIGSRSQEGNMGSVVGKTNNLPILLCYWHFKITGWYIPEFPETRSTVIVHNWTEMLLLRAFMLNFPVCILWLSSSPPPRVNKWKKNKAPYIVNLSTGGRWMINFIPQPHSCLDRKHGAPWIASTRASMDN